jgi:hypothetical protein
MRKEGIRGDTEKWVKEGGFGLCRGHPTGSRLLHEVRGRGQGVELH